MFDQERFDNAKAFTEWLESFSLNLAVRSNCEKCILALWLAECGAESPFAGVSYYGIFAEDGTDEQPLYEMEPWQKEIRDQFDNRATKDKLQLIIKKYF